MNFKAWNELHDLNKKLRELIANMKDEISWEIQSGFDSEELPYLKNEYNCMNEYYQAKRKELGVKDDKSNDF